MARSTATSTESLRLKERLRQELTRLRLRIVGHAALMLLGGPVLLLGATIALGSAWQRLGPAGAWLLIGAIVGLTAWILVFEVLLPLRRLANLKGFSRELERHGAYDNLLEAATQFTSPRRADPLLAQGASADLVHEILRRARLEAERTALAPRIPLVGVGFHFTMAGLSLLLWLILGLAAPGQVHESLAALGHPARLSTAPPQEGLYPVTRDLRVPVGDDVTLLAKDFIGDDIPVVLEVNVSGDFWQEVQADVTLPGPPPQPSFDVTATVPRVKDPFRYRFRKGQVVTETFAVEVRERPVLRELRAQLEPPAYTGRPASEGEELVGTLAVLEGTRVVLEGRSSLMLSAARRIVDGGRGISLEVEEDRFRDAFTVDGDMSFRISLVDEEGFHGEAATVYRFNAIPDEVPTVEIVSPGEDVILTRDLRIGVQAVATDDVGLTQLELLYRPTGATEWNRLPLVQDDADGAASAGIEELRMETGEREVSVAFSWNLNDESLLPGDGLAYCIEATDNNALKGGQTARSSIFHLRLPTVAEIFELQREEREDQGDRLETVLEEGKDLQETLERLRRELKKHPEPDWAKQQEIEDALARQQKLQEEVAEATEELSRMLEEFSKNNSGQMEMLEKMQKLQQMMEELQDESMQAYMQTLQEAMDQLSPQEMQRAIEQSLETQEDYNRTLDRTLALLEQLEQERSLSDLAEEANEYLSRQEELMRRTEEALAEAQRQQDEGEGEGESDSSEEGESSEADGGEESDEGESGEESSSSENSENSEQSSQDSQQNGDSSSESEDGGQSSEDLAEQQEQLARETAAMEQRLRDALEQLKQEESQGEVSDAAREQMQQALEDAMEQMQQQGSASESMKQAGEEMSQNNQQGAAQQQQEALRRMLSLYQTLAEGMSGMNQAMNQAAADDLQETAYDLLHLSFEEERISETLQDGAKGQQLGPVARQQVRVQRGAKSILAELEELASQNILMGESLLESMRELVDSLDKAVTELELGRPRRARGDATTTMGMMNRIVIGLLTTAQSLSQQQSSGQASQQLEQLANQQSRLNGMAQRLQQRMQSGGGLTPEERQQLATLQGMQAALREQLENIQRNVEDERRVLGDLDSIGDEMEEVIVDLETGPTEGTQRKQERILSRLLDAQRSIRQRDFAKRREAESADELYSPQLGAPLAEIFDPERQVRRWLAPERAPHAYRDEVRRYFREIQGKLEASEPNR